MLSTGWCPFCRLAFDVNIFFVAATEMRPVDGARYSRASLARALCPRASGARGEGAHERRPPDLSLSRKTTPSADLEVTLPRALKRSQG